MITHTHITPISSWFWYGVHVCMFVRPNGTYSLLGVHRTFRGISTVPSHQVPTGLSRKTNLGIPAQSNQLLLFYTRRNTTMEIT
ncbi:hypothetical protein AFLA_001144 [Aspergillus flavus NRRL3357]|nr:hypothetical protein AFLA_001144 [Aspergillus flavus NRRL3357]